MTILGFEPEMECENEVPMNHTDLAVAGYPRLDSRCWLKVWKLIFLNFKN